jgi:uncharacterized membrane protein
LIATHLVSAARSLDTHALLFATIYLAVHGLVKVVLVLAILRDKFWAYPWMIATLIAFIGYQVYEMLVNPTVGLLALTIFDALIVWLTWHEYVTHRSSGTPQHPTLVAAQPSGAEQDEEHAGGDNHLA